MKHISHPGLNWFLGQIPSHLWALFYFIINFMISVFVVTIFHSTGQVHNSDDLRKMQYVLSMNFKANLLVRWHQNLPAGT